MPLVNIFKRNVRKEAEKLQQVKPEGTKPADVPVNEVVNSQIKREVTAVTEQPRVEGNGTVKAGCHSISSDDPAIDESPNNQRKIPILETDNPKQGKDDGGVKTANIEPIRNAYEEENSILNSEEPNVSSLLPSSRESTDEPSKSMKDPDGSSCAKETPNKCDPQQSNDEFIKNESSDTIKGESSDEIPAQNNCDVGSDIPNVETTNQCEAESTLGLEKQLHEGSSKESAKNDNSEPDLHVKASLVPQNVASLEYTGNECEPIVSEPPPCLEEIGTNNEIKDLHSVQTNNGLLHLESDIRFAIQDENYDSNEILLEEVSDNKSTNDSISISFDKPITPSVDESEQVYLDEIKESTETSGEQSAEVSSPLTAVEKIEKHSEIKPESKNSVVKSNEPIELNKDCDAKCEEIVQELTDDASESEAANQDTLKINGSISSTEKANEPSIKTSDEKVCVTSVEVTSESSDKTIFDGTASHSREEIPESSNETPEEITSTKGTAVLSKHTLVDDKTILLSPEETSESSKKTIFDGTASHSTKEIPESLKETPESITSTEGTVILPRNTLDDDKTSLNSLESPEKVIIEGMANHLTKDTSESSKETSEEISPESTSDLLKNASCDKTASVSSVEETPQSLEKTLLDEKAKHSTNGTHESPKVTSDEISSIENTPDLSKRQFSDEASSISSTERTLEPTEGKLSAEGIPELLLKKTEQTITEEKVKEGNKLIENFEEPLSSEDSNCVAADDFGIPQQDSVFKPEIQNWKVGYLQVKLPAKCRKAKLKAWQKRWVVIQADEFTSDAKNNSLVLSIYHSESGNSRRHNAAFWKSVSGKSAVIYRSMSRTHSYAFTIADGDEPIVYLSAESETSSQEWIAAIRNILWPPNPVVQLEKVLNGNEFEVSIVDNDFSHRAGLLGTYGYMSVTSRKLILCHPQLGHVIQEWYLNTVDKFQLLPQAREEDANKVLLMHTSSDSSTGRGQLKIFCTEAVDFLKSVASTIHKVLQYHAKGRNEHYRKELADLSHWLTPQPSPNVSRTADNEDYYKVPPRQVRSLLDIPNFIFDLPTKTVIVGDAISVNKSAALKPSKTCVSTISEDSGISLAAASDDVLNCSTTSFSIGNRSLRMRDRMSSTSESSDGYSPPSSPNIEKRQSMSQEVTPND